jgi:hypothetical protein
MKLFDGTYLSTATILGAFAIVDKARVPLTVPNLVAAAFAAYKTYDTCIHQKVSAFQTHVVPGIERTDLKVDEMQVLAAVGWTVPARTRIDCVRNLAHSLGLAGIAGLEGFTGVYERATLRALLVDECSTMEDDAYARVVLYAAVQLAKPQMVAWLVALPTKAVPHDYIHRWGLRVAQVTPGEPAPPDRGAKRKRE